MGRHLENGALENFLISHRNPGLVFKCNADFLRPIRAQVLVTTLSTQSGPPIQWQHLRAADLAETPPTENLDRGQFKNDKKSAKNGLESL